MLRTNEYTTLKKDGKELKIIPNKPFNEIPAGYLVTAYARIVGEDGKTFAILKPGEITTLIKEEPIVVEPKRKQKTLIGS